MSDAGQASPNDLKQRLAGLSASQRALLLRRLGEPQSTASQVNPQPRIPRCRPLRTVDGSAIYPASYSQQRMWFLHHYAPESPVYNSPSAFHLTGPLNVPWLESAFRAVIQRHDILRTSFTLENGEFFQGVAASCAFHLKDINLEKIPADTRREVAGRNLNAEAGRPFDLSAGPAFRAVLVTLQPEEHVLLVVSHHIISDGWSRANFYRELATEYAAIAAGQPSPVRGLPVQFADFSAWQKDWLKDSAQESQTAYWKVKLGHEAEPLDLPSDRSRPALESFRGGRCVAPLDPQLANALKSRAQEEGATFFMILLAAFKALLHRYTGCDDLIVGVPVAGRPRPELEPLIGCFANTLVMRTAVMPGATFRELLRCVKETAVEAYDHQDIPFERLVELLQVRRDTSRTPLFQVSFAVQDFPAVELNLPGIKTAPWFVTTQTSKFDFSLTLERTAEGWTAATEHNTDLFDNDRIERLLAHWQVVLESVAANPDQRVSEIPLLTAAEQQQIVIDWNQTNRDWPDDMCVHQLFQAQASRTPEAMAIEFGEIKLTYGALNVRTNALAARLRSLGVGPDVLVGLCVNRSPDMIVGMLGILKAGGAYVPLDPNYPPERIDYILKDAGARVLVTQRALGFGESVTQRVFVEDQFPDSDAAPGATQPSHLAYVMYTSGSTGRPKGVAIEHRSVVSFMRWIREAFSDAQLSGMLASTSMCFDLSVFEIFGPLSWGGRVVMVTNVLELASPRAPRNVSLINTVPSVLAELFRGGGLPPSIRTVNMGGEALRQPMAELIFQKTSAANVFDLYGPTETTVYSTWARRTPGGVENVGRPIANTQLYILDANGQPLPVGVPGELYIGGRGVARGYWQRPELTAERFVPDRFSQVPGARLFKTGDRARWLPDGNLVLLGRADGQVKLRGFRIELGEIETALRACANVREAVVILRADDAAGPRLVAYLVAQTGEKPDPATLRTRLGKTLPEYMVPAAFVWLNELPLTPNRKVDRKSLPAPGPDMAVKTGKHEQPSTPLELELIRLWQRLFERKSVGRNDNFFELGGHSLLALRLTAEIEKLAGRQVPISTLFLAPTVAALAKKLEDENWVAQRSSLVLLQPMGSELPLFCIHGLYGDMFYFLDLARELGPDRPVYGLQAVGLDGSQPRHTTVQQMAEHYAREIRSVQPDGPYHLAGASLGGWIAHAVAQELVRQKCTVASLSLLDTRASANVPWHVYARVMAPQLAGRMIFHLQRFVNGPTRGRAAYLKEKLSWFRLHLTRSRKSLPVRPLTPNPAPLNSHDFAIDHFEAVVMKYRPEKYPGDVTVFAGADAKYFRHAFFWKQFVTGKVRVQTVNGDHGSLIGPEHAPEFARRFAKILDQAETEAGGFSHRK